MGRKVETAARRKSFFAAEEKQILIMPRRGRIHSHPPTPPTTLQRVAPLSVCEREGRLELSAIKNVLRDLFQMRFAPALPFHGLVKSRLNEKSQIRVRFREPLRNNEFLISEL